MSIGDPCAFQFSAGLGFIVVGDVYRNAELGGILTLHSKADAYGHRQF